MKKLKKKINSVLKVFLALSLLFNNLMPLSVVFADELDNNEENKVVDVGNEPNLGEEDDEGEEELEKPGDEETPGGDETTPGGDETTPGGEEDDEVALVFEVYVDDALFADDYGSVELDKSVKKLDIVAKLSGVEATENYKFVLDGNEYTAGALLNGAVIKSLTFEGYLYGGFNLEIDGLLVDPEGTEEEHYMNYVVEYGTMEDNDTALSAVNSDYVFADGVVTSTNYDEATLLAIAASVFPNATAEIEDNGLFLYDDHDVTAWYGIVTSGDVNGDGKIDQDDLELLINQVLGLEEPTESSDVNGDGEVNDLDVVYLRLMLESGVSEEITEEDALIVAKFGEFSDPVKVGDEFTLEYIVTLNEYTINGISGLIKYDKSLLDLISAEAKVFDLGDMNDDKFLYLGDYLELDIEVSEDGEGNVLLDEEGYPVITFNDTDYVLITLNFKALAPGEATVSVDDVKYYDYSYYYMADEATSINVTIEDDDEEEEEETESPFESITVSGYEVDLGNYTVTVPNDVTEIDLDYVLANSDYDATIVAIPETLAEGENTIIIKVIDENGLEKEYTITVTREAKEEETTVSAVSYTEEVYEEDDEDEATVTPVPSDDDDDEVKDEDNNKLSRVIIIILILLAIAGLIYLIFKDEDDEETKKANRDIDKMKKADDKKIKNENHKKVKKKER